MYVTLAILFAVALIAGIVSIKRGKTSKHTETEVDYGDVYHVPQPSPRNDPPSGGPGHPVP